MLDRHSAEPRRWLPGYVYFRAMPLLSANGTFRTILVLLVIWQVLRIMVRVKNVPRDGPSSPQPRRPKGDVRIEQVQQPSHSMEPLNVEDADFEEIK